MTERSRFSLSGALAGVGCLAFAISAAAAPAQFFPNITSVTFTGSDAKPTIIVHGVDLGSRPKPDPPYHPVGRPPCRTTPTKPPAAYGYDYGGNLFFQYRGLPGQA